MKRKTNSYVAGAKSRMLMAGFVVAIALVGLNLVYVNIHSAQDQVFTQKASDLRVLSQEIVKYATAAVRGEEQAFAALRQSRDQFDEAWTLINAGQEGYVDSGIGLRSPLPAREAEITAAQPGLGSLWNQLRGNIDVVLANRESILGIHAIADGAASVIPSLQLEYDEVVNTLLDNDAPLATIAVAQRQAWLAERIALNISRIVDGSSAAGNAVEQLRRDILLFASNHGALMRGDAALGVERVQHAGARTRLEQAGSLFAQVEAQSGTMLEGAPELMRAATALTATSIDSEALLDGASALSQYFLDSRDRHLASPLTGYLVLMVALLLVVLYGIEVIRQSRAAERTSADANKKNNEAIMTLLEEISDLADGDLSVKASVTEDFTGAIADSINYAVSQLRELVSAIIEVTIEVSESTQSSARTVQQLTSASERQTKSILSVSDSIRDMESSINRVSDNAGKSLEVAKNSVEIASGGAAVVNNTIRSMDTIRDQIQESAKRIKRLGENSQAIGSFVSLINDIADHTNTLSLNAAIQAAMAGEAGKGFGVVADEVHALAERSSDATRQIESLVKVIQRDINEAVHSMEQTTAEVVQGTQLAQRAGTALDDIEKVSQKLAALVEQITQAARAQARTAGEITQSMETIRQVTAETSSGTKATSEFILNLRNLTQRLRNAVAGFSLGAAARSAAPQPRQEPRPTPVLAYPVAEDETAGADSQAVTA